MIPHNRVVLTSEDKAAVQRVLDSGQIGPGPEVEAFERELAERFRPAGAAACVSSGTAALRLALDALTKRPEVWNMPTYACSAILHALEGHEERIVKPVDCELDLTTPKARIAVDTYGLPCVVRDDAVQDFTHAPGASLNGQPCGSMGALSVISFGATKPLGCGSGGAVLGPADATAEIKDRRDYDGKRELRERFNYAWHDIGAAIGRSRLKRLDAENQIRSQIAERYCTTRGFWFPTSEDRIWYRYVIRVPDPDAVIAHFAAHGVEAINPLRVDELLHRQLGLRPEDFPNAEDAAAHTASLPIWPGMSDEQVDCVAGALGSLA